MIDIFRHNGTRIAVAMIDSSASITRKVMECPELSCLISSDKYIEIKRGDYVMINGEKFSFYELPKLSKNASNQFRYDCKLHSDEKELDDTLFLFLDTDSRGRLFQSSTNFDLTATIDEFLSLLVKNANRNGKGWSFSVSGGVDRQRMVNLSFNGENVLKSLKKAVDAFGLEYKVRGKEIFVTDKLANKTGLRFSYPDNLVSPIEVDYEKNEATATKLFVFGGDRNIPKGYNDNKTDRLIMPDGREFLKRDSGYIIEKVKVFDEVYPRRNAKLTSVRKSASGFYFVTDSTIDFDLVSKLKDTTAKIAFTSGLCVGYEFEIASYNSGTKTIEIKQQMDSGVIVPNEAICPRVGDDYVLLDITMPNEYVTRAEEELEKKAKKYFDEECGESVKMSVKPSNIWLNNHSITLDAGDIVRIVCDDMGIDKEIRIESVKIYPFSLRTQEVELANYTKRSRLANIDTQLTRLSESVSQTSRQQTDSENQSSVALNQLNNELQWITD